MHALPLTRASAGAHSLWACKVSQPCGKHLWEVSSSGYRATFIFHFVSRWLKSKVKVKRLISCSNNYEECVLPGISPAMLSFPCVRCSFGSREDAWPLMTCLQTVQVQRLFRQQNWFTLFSHVQHEDMASRSSTVVLKRPFFLTSCGIRADNQERESWIILPVKQWCNGGSHTKGLIQKECKICRSPLPSKFCIPYSV